MDFHTLSRRELQALCKKNKIPANMSNVSMADALKALEFVEGIEEFMNPLESENSSVESPEKSDIMSSAPRTGRRTAIPKTAKKESEIPQAVTGTRRTTRRAPPAISDKSKNEAFETPAAPTGRRRAASTSAHPKMESLLKECVDNEQDGEQVLNEKRGLPKTPGAMLTSKRREVKECVDNEQDGEQILNEKRGLPKTPGAVLTSRRREVKECVDTEQDGEQGLNEKRGLPKTPGAVLTSRRREVKECVDNEQDGEQVLHEKRRLPKTPGAVTSRRREVKECVDNEQDGEQVLHEKRGLPKTPGAVLTSRRREVKEKSSVSHVYSTRRSARVASKQEESSIQDTETLENVTCDSFTDEKHEALDVNSKLPSLHLDEELGKDDSNVASQNESPGLASNELNLSSEEFATKDIANDSSALSENDNQSLVSKELNVDTYQSNEEFATKELSENYATIDISAGKESSVVEMDIQEGHHDTIAVSKKLDDDEPEVPNSDEISECGVENAGVLVAADSSALSENENQSLVSKELNVDTQQRSEEFANRELINGLSENYATVDLSACKESNEVEMDEDVGDTKKLNDDEPEVEITSEISGCVVENADALCSIEVLDSSALSENEKQSVVCKELNVDEPEVPITGEISGCVVENADELCSMEVLDSSALGENEKQSVVSKELNFDEPEVPITGEISGCVVENADALCSMDEVLADSSALSESEKQSVVSKEQDVDEPEVPITGEISGCVVEIADGSMEEVLADSSALSENEKQSLVSNVDEPEVPISGEISGCVVENADALCSMEVLVTADSSALSENENQSVVSKELNIDEPEVPITGEISGCVVENADELCSLEVLADSSAMSENENQSLVSKELNVDDTHQQSYEEFSTKELSVDLPAGKESNDVVIDLQENENQSVVSKELNVDDTHLSFEEFSTKELTVDLTAVKESNDVEIDLQEGVHLQIKVHEAVDDNMDISKKLNDDEPEVPNTRDNIAVSKELNDDEPEVPITDDNMAVSKKLSDDEPKVPNADDEPEVPNTGDNMAVSKELNDDEPQAANTGDISGCLVENADGTEVLVAVDSSGLCENENQSLVSKELNVDTHQSHEEFATKELAGKESNDVEMDLQEVNEAVDDNMAISKKLNEDEPDVPNADDEPEMPNTVENNMAVSKELNDDEPEVPNGDNMAVSKELNDDEPQVVNTEVLVAADSSGLSENENQSLVIKELIKESNVDTHQSYEESATKELAGKESNDVEMDLQEGVHLQLKVHEAVEDVPNADDEPEMPNTVDNNMAVSKELNYDEPEVPNTGEISECVVENPDAICSMEVLVAGDSSGLSENEDQSLVSKESNEEFATEEATVDLPAGNESNDVVHLVLKVTKDEEARAVECDEMVGAEPIVPPQTPISTMMLKPCDKKPTHVSDDKENIDNRGIKLAPTKGKGIGGEVPAEELSIRKLHKMLKALNPGEEENNGNNSGVRMALTKKKEDNGAGEGNNQKPAEELSIRQLHKMLKALNPLPAKEKREEASHDRNGKHKWKKGGSFSKAEKSRPALQQVPSNCSVAISKNSSQD